MGNKRIIERDLFYEKGLLMDYNAFLKICEERNVSPESVLNDLGINPQELKHWQDGIKPKKVDIRRIARYFNVPVEYSYKEQRSQKETAQSSKASASFILPESLPQGTTISQSEADCLCDYLGYSQGCLVDKEIITNSNPNEENLNPLVLVRAIMSKIPAHPAYKELQLKISSKINWTLRTSGISIEAMIAIGFPEEKVYTKSEVHSPHEVNGKIIPPTFDDSKKQPYNIADIEWLLQLFPEMTLDYLLTGQVFFCCYCGRHLLSPEDRLTAKDNNLHHFEIRKDICCRECNQLITLTNTHLSNALRRKGYVDKTEVRNAICNLQEYLEKLNKCDAEDDFVQMFKPEEGEYKMPYYKKKDNTKLIAREI
jgi:hypothetical protein